jgi:hypothetical protein
MEEVQLESSHVEFEEPDQITEQQGVGAFGHAYQGVAERGPDRQLKAWATHARQPRSG